MLIAIDPTVYRWLNASLASPRWWIHAARWASIWLPAAWGLGLVLALCRQGAEGRRRLLYVASAVGLGWLSARLIRWGYPQPRPAHYGMGVQWIAHAANSSLPSMHATGAFAVAQAMHLCLPPQRPWLRAGLWVSAALIALSRVVLGVHFPSDIAAGAILGSLAAWCMWQLWCAGGEWLQRRKARTAAHAPARPLSTS